MKYLRNFQTTKKSLKFSITRKNLLLKIFISNYLFQISIFPQLCIKPQKISDTNEIVLVVSGNVVGDERMEQKDGYNGLTLVSTLIVNFKFPYAAWTFSPSVNRHKWPLIETSLRDVVWPFCKKGTLCSLWRCQLYLKIPSSRCHQ